eukprot:CAMPEP_0195106818 /NCGR_PEP_ID=MMETSP0448-20130528/81711_1 /TAXON_ID=66468 /ORGANISM="Heterocapsa triquestra, Strain CCMP 448" /LENGTH=83 /DNA_ID=CAMNT_0040143155 /DNA_START=414 /DNA_END=665 /DNA_ORIENTATION=-
MQCAKARVGVYYARTAALEGNAVQYGIGTVPQAEFELLQMSHGGCRQIKAVRVVLVCTKATPLPQPPSTIICHRWAGQGKRSP